MNEKIVILGNGFDLRHYLPTKYDHLMLILREIEDLEFSILDEIKFDDVFGNLFKNHKKEHWFYEKICEYYNTDEIIFDKKGLISIQERLKKNNWFKYLKSIEVTKIETWIDFEKEIERVLSIISSYFDSFNSGVLQKIKQGFVGNNIFYQVNKNNDKNYFTNNLQRNILCVFGLFNDTKFSNHSTLETEHVLIIDTEIQYFKEKEYFDLIYSSLEEFVGIFNDYTINIVNQFYRNFKDEKKEDFILKRNKTILFNNIYKIFSFNYTETIFELYKHKDNIDNVINLLAKDNKTIVEFIHGEAIERWEDLNDLKIVLGVSEINKSLKSHKLFQFTKYFQKLHKNTDYLFLDKILKSFSTLTKNGNGYTIYFWGHSLDSSDSEYIKDVFKVLSKSDSEIKIFYHSISGKADQLKNLLNIIDKDTIEDLMKNKRLIFIESTPDNLFAELS